MNSHGNFVGFKRNAYGFSLSTTQVILKMIFMKLFWYSIYLTPNGFDEVLMKLSQFFLTHPTRVLSDFGEVLMIFPYPSPRHGYWILTSNVRCLRHPSTELLYFHEVLIIFFSYPSDFERDFIKFVWLLELTLKI